MQKCPRCGHKGKRKLKTCNKCRVRMQQWNRSDAKKATQRRYYHERGGREATRARKGYLLSQEERLAEHAKVREQAAAWMVRHAERTGFIPTIAECARFGLIKNPNKIVQIRKQTFGLDEFPRGPFRVPYPTTFA